MPGATPDEPCCDGGPRGHSEQQHHDASACYDKACPFDHPYGGPFPHPCDAAQLASLLACPQCLTNMVSLSDQRFYCARCKQMWTVESRPVQADVDSGVHRRRDSTCQAAALVNRPESQRLVLDLLTAYGPSTDEWLARAAYTLMSTISPSRLRTARCELQRAGLVRDTGRVATLRSGRSGVVWAVAA